MADKKTEGGAKPPQVEVFYDVRDGGYWHRLNGRYVCLKKSDLQMHLRTLGLSEAEWIKSGVGMLREIDYPFWDAMNNRQIDYAGPLAGHRAGLSHDGKRVLLITDEAAGVFDDIPKRAAVPKFFFEFVQELLPGDAKSLASPEQPSVMVEQWIHFCHWLAIALRSIRAVDYRPGQVATFCGPRECGKSLLQDIITSVLGGREANPFRYMTGDEKFSENMAMSEHWRIEDPDSTTDMKARRSFGERLKECANNERFNIRAMHKVPLSLPLFRRLTMSINNEPECIARIPPLEPSVEDKISIYKCESARTSLKQFVVGHTPALPMKGVSVPRADFSRAMVKQTIREETPLIRSWLLRQFPHVPDELFNRRCGIVAVHHPELLEELTSLSKEARFLSVIDQVLFDDPKTPTWHEKKSVVLENELKKSDFREDVNKLLNYAGECGSLLGKLAKRHPERVIKRVLDGHALWTIKPPSRNGEHNGTTEKE